MQMPTLEVRDCVYSAATVLEALRKYGFLPGLVREMILDQEIASITLTEAETAQALGQFEQQFQTAAARLAEAQRRGVSIQELRDFVIRACKLAKYQESRWGDQVNSYFLQRKSCLDQVVYSLLRTSDPGLAQELFFRIQDDGVPLEGLAQQYSEERPATNGPVELSALHPDLAKLLAASQPGQLWPPQQVAGWSVLVRLDAKLPATLNRMTRRRLLDELCESWLGQAIESSLRLTGEPLPDLGNLR